MVCHELREFARIFVLYCWVVFAMNGTNFHECLLCVVGLFCHECHEFSLMFVLLVKWVSVYGQQ